MPDLNSEWLSGKGFAVLAGILVVAAIAVFLLLFIAPALKTTGGSIDEARKKRVALYITLTAGAIILLLFVVAPDQTQQFVQQVLQSIGIGG